MSAGAGKDLRTPLKRVRGLGSARNGTGHFWIQRVTAVALIPLVLWLVFLVLSLIGQDAFVVRAKLAEPLTSTLLIGLVIATFWHGQLGLQVVIEDYIHVHWLETTLQVLLKLVASVLTIFGVIAVIRIALGA